MNDIEPQSAEITQWQLPGAELHRYMDTLREQGPVVPVKYFGSDAWLVTNHAALTRAFKDFEKFPPERPYQVGIMPLIGENFQTMTGDRHRLYRKLATPTFRPRMIEKLDGEMLRDLANELGYA